MKIKAFLLVLISGGFLLSSCQKNIDIFVPDPGQTNGPDTSWYSAVTTAMPVAALRNNLLLQPYLDSITVNANIASIVTPLGIQVNFPPNSCATAAGQIVTGKVEVELQVVKKKGDMIRLNKPSTGPNDSLMITAGEIFIRLKKDGQLLQLAPGIRINIHYVDLPTNPLQNFFIGNETNPDHFNWLPTPLPGLDTIIVNPQSYEIYSSRSRWISVGSFFEVNNTAPRVNVTADLASYFTNANTIVFTVFKDIRSVVAMQPELTSRKFITGKLPVGKQITVLAISKQGNDYYLGYESATTQVPVSNPALQHVAVVPVKKSLTEILAFLNSL